MDVDSRKVDVPLEWQDFVYALEEVSHKKNFQNHDVKNWFKVNPLDIFLLGCESLARNEDTYIMLGNVKVGMKNITEVAFEKFRLLEKTLGLMVKFANQENLSSFLRKKMRDFIQQIMASTEMSPFRERYWVSIILHDTYYSNKDNYANEWLEEILDLNKSCTNELTEELNDYDGFVYFDCFLKSLVLELIDEYEKEAINKFNLNLFINELQEKEQCKSFHHGLVILEIIATFDEGSFIGKIFNCLVADFLAAAKMYTSITDDLLSAVFQLLITCSLCQENKQLIILNQIRDVIDHFLSYTRLGEKDVFMELINFLASGLEAGESFEKVIFHDLPNVLATGFDVISGDLQCLVLRYGSSSYRSRYKNSLLNKSLYYVRNCLEIFSSNHEINKRNTWIIQHISCLEDVESVLNNLIELAIHHIEGGDNVVDVLPPAHEENNVNDIKIVDLIPLNTVDSEQNFTEFRKQLIYQLLLLAYKLIINGENIEYTFADVLPQVFSHTYLPAVPQKYQSLVTSLYPKNMKKTIVPWKIDKKNLALCLLKFTNDAFDIERIHPFLICGVLIPKFVKDLDHTALTDEEKLLILLDVIDLCHENLKSTNNCINNLLSHGMDLILLLLPTNQSLDSIKESLHQIYSWTLKISSTGLLFLKSTCEFFLTHFHDEIDDIQLLMKYLLKKNNRDDIRMIHLLCKPWWIEKKYEQFRKIVYSYATHGGKLKSRSLHSLIEILFLNESIQQKYNSNTSLVDSKELVAFGDDILRDVLNHYNEDLFTPTYQKFVMNKLEHFILYEVLLPDHFQLFLTGEQKFDELEKKLPNILQVNPKQMENLSVVAKRINGMQLPRYDHLKHYLLRLVEKFLLLFEQQPNINVDDALKTFHDDISKDSKNEDKIKALVTFGYADKLWSEECSVEVETSGLFNFEENLRQTLLALFNEYVRLLDSLILTHAKIDGNNVPINEIFSDELSLVELKSRRVTVVKTLDQYGVKQQSILEKKFDLLSREEKIEQEIEHLAKQPTKKMKFKAKINMNFFDCATCCGPQIVGCYSPSNGEHCERPLEIGFRCDSAFASIYDESGTEIENCEMLFTDQGVYVYKSYTSGHPFDTSEVWMMLFVEVLDNKESIPAIILPYHHPNRKTWELMQQFITPDLNGRMITCTFDYSNDWRTYYDFRPESFGHGKDLFLTKGFREKTRKTSFTFTRQFSINSRVDLSSMIFDDFMQKLLDDEKLKQFRFLGKSFIGVLNDYLQNGVFNSKCMSDNFHYDRWKKKSKSEVSKNEIIGELSSFILKSIKSFIDELDMHCFYWQHNRQFLKLREFLTKYKTRNTDVVDKSMLTIKNNMDAILSSRIKVFEISELEMTFQETLMRWIFENEDRTWRYRGGRDGHETYAQFLSFLKSTNEKGLCFPGVVCCIDKHGTINDASSIQLEAVIAYSIGEYLFHCDGKGENDDVKVTTDGETYEIVTAWVDPRYRDLKLSTDMYLKTFKSVQSKYVLFDMLQGSISSVIKTNALFRVLRKLGVQDQFIATRSSSYEVLTLNGKEQFEKIILRRKAIVISLAVFEFMNSNFVFLVSLFILIVAVLLYTISRLCI